MNIPKRPIAAGILLVCLILFCGIDPVHVGGKMEELLHSSYESAFLMDMVPPLYAADYKSGDTVKAMPVSNLPAKKTRGAVTSLRILSVIAMSILLVWYIRRKMKL